MQHLAVIKSGRFWLDDEGFFRGEAAPQAEQSLADAEEQVAAQRAMGVSLPRPFIMDIRSARALKREARAYYSSKDLLSLFSATALIVGSPLSRAIGNFFLGLNKPAMPTRLFSSEADALVWARTFPLPK